jgi:hypothetical protein
MAANLGMELASLAIGKSNELDARIESGTVGRRAMMGDPKNDGAPPDQERVTRDAEDAVTYPILTETVSFPRSGGGPMTGAGSSQSGAGLGQTAALAIGDVLGWKVSGTDPKGFVGALTQAFTLTDIEGHVESTWNPRTYAVQTDLGGGITGAQASLYARAKDALDQSLSLLDGLYPLDPDADPEYVKALREMARSQMTEIVREFGAVGLPSVLRIDTYFEILLGQHPGQFKPGLHAVQFDPDEIKGTLGHLRNTYGIYFRGNRFNNSIEDEQDITNFRVISDYMTSLMQSWIANRGFFYLDPDRQAFFGTQLVLISRQLNVIVETVEEARFVLDSVFIGPNERRTLLLRFDDDAFPPMFLEDLLEEIVSFVKDEGPRLLRDGGKISVTNNILPVVRSLKEMVVQARNPKDKHKLPDGFKTARVHHSLDDLRDQLGELIRLAEQVEQKLPPVLNLLRIDGLSNPYWDGGNVLFSVFGANIHPKAEVHFHSDGWTQASVEFLSAERINVCIANPPEGPHQLRITNPDKMRVIHAFDVPPQTGDKPAIANISMAPATMNSPYSRTLQVAGGTPPYTLAVANDSLLPPGLELKQGAISGTPSASGNYSFFVKITDAERLINTQQVSVVVAPQVAITTATIPDATAGSAYSQALQATGGVAPYVWTYQGVTPKASEFSVNDGVISGTPGTAGPQAFTVTATDANGASVTKSLRVHVAQRVSITTANLPHARAGLFYSQQLQSAGGTSGHKWKLLTGSLPAGLTISPDGVISGTPEKTGDSGFRLMAVDANNSSAEADLGIEVRASIGSLFDGIDKKVDGLEKRLLDGIVEKMTRVLDERLKERKNHDT